MNNKMIIIQCDFVMILIYKFCDDYGKNANDKDGDAINDNRNDPIDEHKNQNDKNDPIDDKERMKRIMIVKQQRQ